MKDDLFTELLESVHQGGAILRGKQRPSRAFRFIEPNVRAVRKGYGLSQAKFAALMGISAATLRNWEQGRRRPEGSARVLLRVVARHPEAVLDVVTGASSNQRLERTGRRASRHRRWSLAAGRSAAGR
jgi:putative transcriptional regulator